MLEKVNTGRGEGPVIPFLLPGLIQNAFFFPARQRYLPYALRFVLRVIKTPSVRRFGAKQATIPGYLHRGSSLERHSPQLKVFASPVGVEVDPLSVSRPTGSSVIRSG